jgi:glutamate dehydrogenase
VWLLRELPRPLRIEEQVLVLRPSVDTLRAKLPTLLEEGSRVALETNVDLAVHQGVTPRVAAWAAELPFLGSAFDIARIAAARGIPVERTAAIFYTIGHRFGFDWLRRAARQLPTDTAWKRLATTAIVDDLFGHQSTLTARMLDNSDGTEPEQLVESWIEGRRPLVSRTEQLLNELQAATAPDLSMLAVASRQLKAMSS